MTHLPLSLRVFVRILPICGGVTVLSVWQKNYNGSAYRMRPCREEQTSMKNGVYQYSIKMSASIGPRYGRLGLNVLGAVHCGFPVKCRRSATLYCGGDAGLPMKKRMRVLCGSSQPTSSISAIYSADNHCPDFLGPLPELGASGK